MLPGMLPWLSNGAPQQGTFRPFAPSKDHILDSQLAIVQACIYSQHLLAPDIINRLIVSN